MSAADGGSAFPVLERDWDRDSDRDLYSMSGGMSLRDYFAANVLQGVFSDSGVLSAVGQGPKGRAAEIATACYEMADAMLQVREAA